MKENLQGFVCNGTLSFSLKNHMVVLNELENKTTGEKKYDVMTYWTDSKGRMYERHRFFRDFQSAWGVYLNAIARYRRL